MAAPACRSSSTDLIVSHTIDGSSAGVDQLNNAVELKISSDDDSFVKLRNKQAVYLTIRRTGNIEQASAAAIAQEQEETRRIFAHVFFEYQVMSPIGRSSVDDALLTRRRELPRHKNIGGFILSYVTQPPEWMVRRLPIDVVAGNSRHLNLLRMRKSQALLIETEAPGTPITERLASPFGAPSGSLAFSWAIDLIKGIEHLIGHGLAIRELSLAHVREVRGTETDPLGRLVLCDRGDLVPLEEAGGVSGVAAAVGRLLVQLIQPALMRSASGSFHEGAAAEADTDAAAGGGGGKGASSSGLECRAAADSGCSAIGRSKAAFGFEDCVAYRTIREIAAELCRGAPTERAAEGPIETVAEDCFPTFLMARETLEAGMQKQLQDAQSQVDREDASVAALGLLLREDGLCGVASKRLREEAGKIAVADIAGVIRFAWECLGWAEGGVIHFPFGTQAFATHLIRQFRSMCSCSPAEALTKVQELLSAGGEKARSAAFALMLACEGSEEARGVFGPKVLAGLGQRMREDTAEQCAFARAMAAVAGDDPRVFRQAFKGDGAECLVRILGGSRPEMVLIGAKIVLRLLRIDPATHLRAGLLSHEVVGIAEAGLQSEWSAVAASFAEILALARKTDFSRTLPAPKPEVIEALVALLQCRTGKAAEHAADALLHVSQATPAGLQAVVDAGGIKPLVGLLGSTKGQNAAKAVGSLLMIAQSTQQGHVRALGEAGAAMPLIRLLGYEDADTAAIASQILMHLIHPQHARPASVGSGEGELAWDVPMGQRHVLALLELAREGRGSTEQIVALLGRFAIARNRELVDHIVQLGGIDLMLEFVERGTESERDLSIAAMYALSLQSGSVGGKILRARKLGTLIDQLGRRSQQPHGTRGAVVADTFTAMVPQLIAFALKQPFDALDPELRNGASIQTLVGYLDTGSNETKVHSCLCLSRIASKSRDWARVMAAKGCVRSLVNLIRHPPAARGSLITAQLPIRAAYCLGALARTHDSHCTAIVEESGIPAMMVVLQSSLGDGISQQLQAANVFGTLSAIAETSPANRRSIVDGGTLPVIVEALSSGHSTVQIAALRLACCIAAGDHETKARLGREGVIRAASHLLKRDVVVGASAHSSNVVRYLVSAVLWHQKQPTVPLLVGDRTGSVLEGICDKIRDARALSGYAIMQLRLLATESEEWQMLIVRSGVMRDVARLVSAENSAVGIAATRCLVTVACSFEDYRQEVAHEALPTLESAAAEARQQHHAEAVHDAIRELTSESLGPSTEGVPSLAEVYGADRDLASGTDLDVDLIEAESHRGTEMTRPTDSTGAVEALNGSLAGLKQESRGEDRERTCASTRGDELEGQPAPAATSDVGVRLDERIGSAAPHEPEGASRVGGAWPPLSDVDSSGSLVLTASVLAAQTMTRGGSASEAAGPLGAAVGGGMASPWDTAMDDVHAGPPPGVEWRVDTNAVRLGGIAQTMFLDNLGRARGVDAFPSGRPGPSTQSVATIEPGTVLAGAAGSVAGDGAASVANVHMQRALPVTTLSRRSDAGQPSGGHDADVGVAPSSSGSSRSSPPEDTQGLGGSLPHGAEEAGSSVVAGDQQSAEEAGWSGVGLAGDQQSDGSTKGWCWPS